MAKKIKFPLSMENGVQVRTLEELREHFNLEKTFGYYLDGKLLTWLNDRYYEYEAGQIAELDNNISGFTNRFCEIFGITNKFDFEIELDLIRSKHNKISKLKQCTNKEEIIENVECVAFNEKELSDLLDAGISPIYLYEGKFNIPISRKHITYIGINSPIAIIKSRILVDFSSKNIVFKDIRFNEEYGQVEKNSKRHCSTIIGIDLGTTNSCVAVMEGGKPVIITNAEGSRTTPSVVSLQNDGKWLVGQAAKMQSITNPDRTISSIARQIGTNYKAIFQGREYTSQEILATILQKLKRDAESYIGKAITEAVITVPTCYGFGEMQAIKDAGKIAGLEVKRCMTTTLATAIYYGVDKQDYNQKILVYDIGGGTFGISILELGDGLFEVKSVNGNIKLGGDDFDEKIVDFIADTFKIDNGIDLRNDNIALKRLKEASEIAKIELSSSMHTADMKHKNIALVYQGL